GSESELGVGGYMFEAIRMVRRLGAVVVAGAMALSSSGPAAAGQSPPSTCRLGSPAGTVQHIIYIQFDNVHFTRDNPNVPSDLEQMPHLLNFLTDNGVLLTNHHTPLISHTGGNILTGLTGVYPDRHGQAVSNSYRYYNPDGTST